jgi:hypothetical protein
MELNYSYDSNHSFFRSHQGVKGEYADMVCFSDEVIQFQAPGFLNAHLHGPMSCNLAKSIPPSRMEVAPPSLTIKLCWNANHMSINTV